MRRDLPTGTVTFLFTDIEGSTRLLHQLGEEAYARALAEHRRLVREAFARRGGVEVDTQGDAFFVVFPTAPSALEAAKEAQEALARGPVRVRIGLHTGTPHVTDEGYVGRDVHKAARIAAAGHGGQVLLSTETRELVDASVTDLGEHRLKDFDEPVPIFQLGPGRFPPLKTISNTNLPRPASSFVGREREVQEVASLLRDGARLLTLTGPGGTGKTRLAIEAASELVPGFKAGVFWVGLAPLRDPALVAEEIARTLGATDGLAAHISERELLLVLDNLEQVIEAATELASLVETCPNLVLLVTSRELLRVRGEVEYPVAPLADPEAVELFHARAQTEPDDAVLELCRALDNLPLALELAAAHARVLSPRELLERISGRLDLLKGGRDADPRQQTLRATIAWSYDLLTAEEQRLFARLAVFAGGCTLDSAEEVAEADLDVLRSLVEKSLVRRTRERYWMLETIREYATERIEGSSEAEELQRRHAEHFLRLAEEADVGRRWDSKELLDTLEREHDNFRVALERFEASGETQPALRLAGALFGFWFRRGYIAEAQLRLEQALRADERPTAARAKALNGASWLALQAGGNADAVATRWAEEALHIHRTLGDRRGIGDSMYTLAHAVAAEGDWARHQQLLEESLQWFRELGDERYVQLVIEGLAWNYRELGDYERARALLEENLRRTRATSNRLMEAFTIDGLADVARDEGRAREALSLLKTSLPIYRDLDLPLEIAANLGRFAAVLAKAGRAGTAARLLSRSVALYAEIGAGVPFWDSNRDEETLTAIRAQLDEGAFEEAWEQGRTLTADEAVALALGEAERDA